MPSLYRVSSRSAKSPIAIISPAFAQVVVSLPDGLALPSSTSAKASPVTLPSWLRRSTFSTLSNMGEISTGPPTFSTSKNF